jgi:hypothetical protein
LNHNAPKGGSAGSLFIIMQRIAVATYLSE